MDTDDLDPRPAPDRPADLGAMSIEVLEEYVASLESEIRRAEDVIESKKAARDLRRCRLRHLKANVGNVPTPDRLCYPWRDRVDRVSGSVMGWPFQMEEHHVPQGRAGCEASPSVHQGRAGDRCCRQIGPAGSRTQSPSACGHPGRPRGEHVQGCHRPGHQAQHQWRRGGRLSGDTLRGLRAGRRGDHRRGP